VPARKASLRVPCLANPHHDEVAIHLKDRNFVWVDLSEPDEEQLARLSELIGLHPLTLEDAHTFRQRPKLEEYLYYRDLYDSLIRVAELVDSYRDRLSGATGMYLSTVANRQGQINKQLTVIATILSDVVFGLGSPGHLGDRLRGLLPPQTLALAGRPPQGM
jgi:Mg2+ and Co2+ transporter CorA